MHLHLPYAPAPAICTWHDTLACPCHAPVIALLFYTPCVNLMCMRQTVHQVIATFLQFDAATVRELQAARQRKGAAQRGLIGRASLLFSQR